MRRIEPIPEGAVEALAILHAACFPDDPWEAGALARIMALSGGFGWLAWEGEEPAGFILVRDLGNECEILSLGVAPRWRRRGIAQELLATSAAEATRRKLPSLVLEVAVDNDSARDLYAATGFVTVGRRARYYRRPDGRADALILRRALARRDAR
ncbi:MAG TPA: GNAT family N-acetyltransferase [Stellaceae bacterium]|jgi:ribosomal-protein-alanine N-acetyltransferase|nr:GNAT family N-acetyltransferase [Stellaceae bacterium]